MPFRIAVSKEPGGKTRRARINWANYFPTRTNISATIFVINHDWGGLGGKSGGIKALIWFAKERYATSSMIRFLKE